MSDIITEQMATLSEKQNALVTEWKGLLDNDNYEPINEQHRRVVTAQILENQAKDSTPTTALGESVTTTASMAGYDPVLINMVRRSVPKLIAYDICGVQPMDKPTGLIFAMKARYGNGTGDEALYNKVKTGHSGDKADDTTYNDGTVNPFLAGKMATLPGKGGETKAMETGAWNSMSASIESVPVRATTRHLRAELSIEVQQDWRSVHNVDAEFELSNILAQEVLVETNQELVQTIYKIAKVGAQGTTQAGTFSLKDDSDGRWMVERYKGLLQQINRDANRIAIDTRRGRGNILITSADVASALQMAGVLDFAPALAAMTNMNIDIAGTAYAGNIGQMKVFIDPYLQHDGYVVGYKGNGNAYDSGIFYSPYLILQPASATDTKNFNKAIGFKSRYAVTANPFTSLNADENIYYRKASVKL